MSDSLKVFSPKLFRRVKQLLGGLTTRKVTRHLTPFAQQQKKGRRGGAEDSQAIEEENYGLEESEQQMEDKDEDDDIENSTMPQAAKQEKLQGEEGEKQRKVPQQKRPRLREKGKAKKNQSSLITDNKLKPIGSM